MMCRVMTYVWEVTVLPARLGRCERRPAGVWEGGILVNCLGTERLACCEMYLCVRQRPNSREKSL